MKATSCALLVACCALPASAAPAVGYRVPYAPVTYATVLPAVQQRASRHYLLGELETAMSFPTWPTGRLVLHDARGERDPKVVLPAGPGTVGLDTIAMREDAAGVPVLLALTDAALSPADDPSRLFRYLVSTDAGATWRDSGIPGRSAPLSRSAYDVGCHDAGGPVAYERGAQVRLGTEDVPFFVAAPDGVGTALSVLWAIPREGAARVLATPCCSPQGSVTLVGGRKDGSEVLIHAELSDGGSSRTGFWAVDALGRRRFVSEGPRAAYWQQGAYTGWITPSGAAYVLTTATSPACCGHLSQELSYVSEGAATSVWSALDAPRLTVSPTADYAGAWVVQRDGSTVLSLHTPGGTLTPAWSDPDAPVVDAIIPGASGRTLLLQAEGALALYEVGQSAPPPYQEFPFSPVDFIDSDLFVNVDVDELPLGGAFVFANYPTIGGWAVRGSLRQKLVFPAVARSAGAHGSFWRTDLLVRNPLDAPQTVALQLAHESCCEARTSTASLRLDPHEIRSVPDVLGALFGEESASGSLFVVPEGSGWVKATSRTYTTSALGTYGMGEDAVDVSSVAPRRFPMTYSAALAGPGFRTNLVLTDLGGRGASGTLSLFDSAGAGQSPPLGLRVPAGGSHQLNDLAMALGLDPGAIGAASLQLTSGEAIGSAIVIDNRTNDATYDAPDVLEPVLEAPSHGPIREILPAIVDSGGIGGVHWRTDLFAENVTPSSRTITLVASTWDGGAGRTATITLLPYESKVIDDALPSLFGMSGVALLRYSTGEADPWPSRAVRLGARIYTQDAAGGTFGMQMPPLADFAGPGGTLEILGPVGGAGHRTNLCLFELRGQPVSVRVEILDEKGTLVDRFDTGIPAANGRQIDDLFRTRGLGDGPKAALVRISPSGRGVIGAYATLIDNGTGDPTYFGAVRAGTSP